MKLGAMKVGVDAEALKSAGWRLPVGLLGLAMAVWFGWGAWTVQSAKNDEQRATELRVEVAGDLQRRSGELLKEMATRSTQESVVNAAAQGDLALAGRLLQLDWKGVAGAEVHALDLVEPYVNAETFGFGKLGLLESAVVAGEPQLAVLKDGTSAVVGVASVLRQGENNVAVAYARFPMETVERLVRDAKLDNQYLALRQGRRSLIEAGEKSYASRAEVDAKSIPGTTLRVVSAADEVPPGLFNAEGKGEIGMALAGLLLAGVAAFAKRRKPAADQDVALTEGGEQTLAEVTQGLVGNAARERDLAPRDEPTLAAASADSAPAPKPVVGVAIDRSIFRAYDIRGVMDKTLNVHVARQIGQAVGSLMAERSCRTMVVGRDGRLSSPKLSEALIEGLLSTGRDVVDIGEAPTPLAYFGAFQLRTGCAISITGSHNPPDYNGFKIVVDGETLSGDAIQALYARIAENRLLKSDSPGQVSRRSLDEDYIHRIAGDVQIERKLRVVCDAGSGVAGAIAPRLLEAIGAEVEPLFCEVDGTFPHHHPDPSDPHNLEDLIRVVQRVDADLGVAFDGDGDRLGVVTKSGQIIYPDRLLMLFAADVLERNPGACIIYDVKCTGHLATQILRHGGSPLMWKTGHSLIKAKMKETEAELAGEMSGHFFFRERWFGFDDGLYAACRLLEILAANPQEPEEVFAALPQGVSTPELKIAVEEGEQYTLIEKFTANAVFDGARITTIDGLRADWSDGWGLIRASNTTPILVLRFDAKNQEALERVQALFRAQLAAVLPQLKLPF